MQPPSLSNTTAGRYNSAALEQERLVFDRPCLFQAAVLFNNDAVDLYLWVEDRNDVSGVFPSLAPIKVPAGETRSLDWTLAPRSMSSGIYVCASTSPTLKTLSGSNASYFEVAYAIS